tara:strand:- start:308 stop:1210 length:903 start_codon:yes stop_codon:yes gene_type:complete
MLTILLTGATGFLGSNLLEAFHKKKYKIIILKRSNSNTHRIDYLMENVSSYNLDITPIESVFKDNDIDLVVHTACNYGRGGESFTQIIESNFTLGINLLENAIKYGAPTFINTDTFLKKRVSDYSLSKRQFSEWLEAKSEDIQIVNLKLEHMYGEKDDATKLVPWILSQFKQKKDEIKLTYGEQKRDFIYIQDVISAYLVVIDNIANLNSFNEFHVGNGSLITVKRFIEKLKESYEINCEKSSTKLNFGALPYRDNEDMTVNLDNKPLKDLGWLAEMDLDEGLKKVVKAFNKNDTKKTGV